LRGGVGGGGIQAESLLYFMRDAVDIANHIVIPEMQHFEFITAQMFISRGIRAKTNCSIVLTAVDFDDYPGRKTNEVDNVIVDRSLAPEMETLRFQETQKAPKLSLCIC
jgi:hypothetical protein